MEALRVWRASSKLLGFAVSRAAASAGRPHRLHIRCCSPAAATANPPHDRRRHQHDKRIEESKEEDVYPRRVQSHDLPAKIRIVMKSFNNQKYNLKELEPYEQKIGLPESRSLYTVLRSPHIDKKSREQFSTHVKKLFVVKEAKTHELSKKFFWLKRLRILGAQYEIQISFKTRLDNKTGCIKGLQ